LNALGQELRAAFLARDAKTIGEKFSNSFAATTYFQRITNEKVFHICVQLILAATGLKVRSELPGATTRLDLLVELENNVYVLIELKCRDNPKKATQAERNAVLALLAKSTLEKSLLDKELSMSNLSRQYDIGINKAIDEYERGDTPLTKEERVRLIGNAIRSLASIEEVEAVLAKLAENRLKKEEIEEALTESSGPELSPSEVDKLLTDGVNEALRDISQRGYHKMIANEAKEIIDLGLAIYEHGSIVKASFGPKSLPNL
jgi:hypothetical protein